MANRWRTSRYKSFDFTQWNPLNQLPNKMEKYLPIFKGNNIVIREEHIKLFIQALYILNVEHEDVVLKIFYHSMSKDAKEWI